MAVQHVFVALDYCCLLKLLKVLFAMIFNVDEKNRQIQYFQSIQFISEIQ